VADRVPPTPEYRSNAAKKYRQGVRSRMTLKSAVVVATIGGAALAASSSPLRGQSTASHSVLDGVFTEAQAKRGERLYGQLCTSCHGPALAGDDEAPGLTGGAFMSNWSGTTVGELADRIRLTTGKLPHGEGDQAVNSCKGRTSSHDTRGRANSTPQGRSIGCLKTAAVRSDVRRRRRGCRRVAPCRRCPDSSSSRSADTRASERHSARFDGAWSRRFRERSFHA
jgi:hypothetical protein